MNLVSMRAREGGLRIGEMEKDALVSHGASQFLLERLRECSDMYSVWVCDECGLIAQKMINKDNYYCPACNNYNRVSQVNTVYGFKLLAQELMSVNILPRIKTENSLF